MVRYKAVIISAVCLAAMLLATGCGDKGKFQKESSNAASSSASSSTEEKAMITKAKFTEITPEEAKKIMDEKDDVIILDVREQDEYDAGHVVGAIVLSYKSIGEKIEALIPDKNAEVLVYCRSGRRSKIAAQEMADMGYTNIQEFGGITDWPYETEK